MDKAEWHLPDRCLRQFGLRQSIPKDVQRRETKNNEVDNELDTSKRMDSELQEWSNRWQNIVDVVEDGDGTDESEYTTWYSNISRKLVHRRAFAPSQFQESVRLFFPLLSYIFLIQMLSGPIHIECNISYV